MNFNEKNFIVKFYIIKYNFQLDRFSQEFLDMLLYIELKFYVNRNPVKDYSRESNLLDKSCQLYLHEPSSTFELYIDLQKEFW